MQKFTTNLSPYKFAKAIDVHPQMVYNYIKNGLLAAEVNDLGKKFLTPDTMNAYVEKRAAKAAEKAAKEASQLVGQAE